MTEHTHSRLHLWDGGSDDRYAGTCTCPPAVRAASAHRAGELFLQEGLTTHLRRRRELPDAFSFQWFLEAESLRYGRHGRWLPRLLEFSKHSGDRVLGLGPGLGTDWAQYARHGADVIACCPSADQLGLVEWNFQLRGLRGRFIHASPMALPLEPASIDVVCVSSLLRESKSPPALVDEVYRVLKPGGKVLALAPAAYDVNYWCRRLRLRSPERQTENGFSLVTAEGMSARSLRRLFGAFTEARVQRRQLRRHDLPPLLRWAPLPLFERLCGRFFLLKAFKPLSAAVGARAAA